MRGKLKVTSRLGGFDLTNSPDQMHASVYSCKWVQPYRYTLHVHQCCIGPATEHVHACELYDGGQSWYAICPYICSGLLTCHIGTARVNAELCMLSDESQRSSIIAYTIAVYAVALTLVALRVAGKIVSTGVAWNDAPIVAAVLLAAVPIASVLASELIQNT